MPVLPQPNLSPGVNARIPSASTLTTALQTELKAQERKPAVQSFTEGVASVQGIVQGQQKIEENELELERQALADSLSKEMDQEDLLLTQALRSGSLDDQTNALYNTDPKVLIRNRDAVLAVADRIVRKGTPDQKAIMENEVIPIVDRERIQQEKAAEDRAQEANQRIRLTARLRDRSKKRDAANNRGGRFEQEGKLLDRRKKIADVTAAEARADKLEGGGVTKEKEVKRQSEDIGNFLIKKRRTKDFTAFQSRINREVRRARENGTDATPELEKINKDFVDALDTDQKKEFLRRASPNDQNTKINQVAGLVAGRSVLINNQQVDILALEQQAIAEGKITQQGLNFRVEQELAQLKDLLRKNPGSKSKFTDAQLRQQIKARVLLEVMG